MVVNKQPGVSIHSESGSPGLIQTLCIDFGKKLYPVHRLDAATSGVLLLAKTAAACRVLSQHFQARRVEKYYLAISDKKPQKKQGLVKGDMVPSRRGCWMLTKTYDNPAITQFFSHSIAPGRRLFILKPHTGKTHQLRVAMKSIGAGILGDTRYRTGTEANRMYLHAYTLRFQFEGSHYTYHREPDDGEFAQALPSIQTYYQEPWSLPWPKL